MSNFTDFIPCTAGQNQAAPTIWSCSTTDSLETITATGYLNDKYVNGYGPLKPDHILFINYLIDGEETQTAGIATLSGQNLNFVAGLPGSSEGDVDSVFGRTGNVVATTGDYSVNQITGAAPTNAPTFTGGITASGGMSLTGGISVTENCVIYGNTTLGGTTSTNNLDIVGNFTVWAGLNGIAGTFTLNGATPVVVNNSKVISTSLILMSTLNPSGTPGFYHISNLASGTFSVTGTSGDTSTIGYMIVNPRTS